MYIFDHIAQFYSERKILQSDVVEKLETHILCSKRFFSENRAAYEIMWGNMSESYRPQVTV